MAELRATAYKVRIKDLLNSQYIKEEETQNNYLIVNGNNISRVNLLATIISAPMRYTNYSQVTVDDGSGRINIRNFDNPDFFNNLEIGDVVLIIAKPREYNNERYLIGEIIKKLKDQRWLKVRELELRKNNEVTNVEEKKLENLEKSYDDILQTISSLDSGEGVDFDKLITEFKIDQNKLNYLLEKGEIFFVKPGKIKILE